MNDIDPAKMTEAERKTLFASFFQGMTPAAPPRKTLAELLAPWISSIQNQRQLGFDWKQLAQICTTNLKVNITPATLERTIRDATPRKVKRKKTGKPAGSAPTPTASPDQKPI